MILGPIIGFDPGTTTGVACWTPERNGLAWADEFPALQAVRVIWNALDHFDAQGEPKVTVVGERYDITADTVRKMRNSDPIDVIGAVRFKVELLEDEKRLERFSFVRFPRSDGKTFATNDKLRALGWYMRGKQHANDAIRYVLMHAVDHDSVLRQMISGLR